MKKVLITSILILAIISSLLAGTVSYYTTTIDVAAGSVTAKEFIFASEHKENSFTKNTKIAPGETVNWSFRVMNHENGIITETDLYYKLTFTLNAADGKQAIEPVEVNIRDSEDGSILATATHSQAKDITGKFFVADKGQAKDYFVEVVWPHGDNDSAYAGSSYGSAITVSAVASQVPFDSETQPVEPEEPGEPGEGEGPVEPTEGDIHIIYKSAKPNSEAAGHRYEFEITIKNNTNVDIDGWYLEFLLPNTTRQYIHNATDQSDPDSNGIFKFANPNGYNIKLEANSQIDDIGGTFISSDGTARTPQNVTFNGASVTIEHIKDFK